MLALFLSFLQVRDEDAGEAFLTENEEKEKEVEGEEEVEDEEEIDKEEAEEGIASARPIVDDVEKGTRRNQPGTDDHRPLSSAGEEFTECMDCFRQWTHLCTEDRQNSSGGGGDGRQTERGVGGRSGVQGEPGAAAGRGGRQTDRGGGQAGRGGRRASGVGRGRGLNTGRDGDRQGGPGEPTVRRIPSTSAEEADTQSTT